jgi:hypothetical protein
VRVAPARPFEVLSPKHPGQSAVGAGYDYSGEVLLAHPSCNPFSASARPDRARAEQHRVFRADALSGAQRLAAEETQDDAFAVRDDADLPFVRYAFGDG